MASETTDIGVRLLIRARAVGRVRRPLLLATAIVAGGALVALAHIAGVDLRALSAGQPGLVPDLVRTALPDQP
jgi:hypothetical protein